MSEQPGQEPTATPFAPPGGPRPSLDAARAADEPSPPADAASPYAPPAVRVASPAAPPYGQAGAWVQPAPYAPPGTYPQDAALGQAVPVAPQPAYGSPVPYGPTQYSALPAPHGVSGPYGTPGGFGYSAAPPTEGLAIASLVTSVAGLLFLLGIPGPVGVGLGIAALRRVRRRGTKGRGLAIAGVVVGAVGTLVCVGWVWLAVWLSSNPDVVSGLAEDQLPDYTLRTDLVVGDCLREYPDSWDLGTADPVDCDEAHALEIVAALPMSSPVDPLAVPSDAGYDRGFAECTAQIERAAPGLLDETTVWTDVSFPHPDDWSAGATTALCAVATDFPELRGSVLDGSVTGPE